MNRFVATIAAALALTVAPLAAFAGPAQATHGAVAEKDGKEGKAKFPMPAAEFRAHVAKRIEKAKARLEKHIADKKVPEDKAKEARAKQAEVIAKVNAEVDKVTADGTVTKEEAKQVFEVAKALHPHHGKKNPPAKKA